MSSGRMGSAGRGMHTRLDTLLPPSGGHPQDPCVLRTGEPKQAGGYRCGLGAAGLLTTHPSHSQVLTRVRIDSSSTFES